jgi:prevent-host-death family protein
MTVVAESHTTRVSLDEIKQDLSNYVQRVQAGEIFVVTKAGKPVAEIRPIATAQQYQRPFGLAAGQFTIPDDFDAPLPDQIVREFEES